MGVCHDKNSRSLFTLDNAKQHSSYISDIIPFKLNHRQEVYETGNLRLCGDLSPKQGLPLGF